MKVGSVSQIWRYPVKSMAGEALQATRVEHTYGVAGDRGWALYDEAAGELCSAKHVPQLLQCGARYRSEPRGSASPAVDIELADGRILCSDEPDVSAAISEALGGRLRLCSRRPASDLAHYRRAQPIGAASDAESRAVFALLPDEPLPDLSDVPAELREFATPPGTYFDAFELHLVTTAALNELARHAPASRIDVRRFRPNLVVAPGGPDGFPEFDWCGKEVRIGEVRGVVLRPMLRCAMTTHPQRGLEKDPAIMRALVRVSQMNLGIGVGVMQAGTIHLGDPVEVV